MARNLDRWLIIAVIGILVSGFVIVLWAAQSEDRHLRDQLLIETSLAETGIGAGQVLALAGSEADLISPDYLQLKGQMAKIRSTDPFIRFAYLMGERPDGTVFIFVDSENPTSEDYSPPGDVYAEASGLLHNTFTNGEMATEGPLNDRWGTWVTGFVPLKDPETGRVIAVLGMDVDARNWNGQIATACAPAIAGMLLVMGLVLASFFVQKRNEREKLVLEKSEKAIRERETQLRSTLDSTADGILAVDNTGKVLQSSRRFAELWKIPPSLMERGDDRTLLAFVLGQLADPEAFLKKVQSLYGSDAVDMDTLAFRDGRVFERYSSPMIMDGARIGRVWSFRDITERKRAEDALKESESFNRNLVENLPEYIAVYAPDGKILYVNPASVRAIGYSAEDLSGTSVLSYVAPEYRGAVTSKMAARWKEGAPSAYEIEIIAKDGLRRSVIAKGTPIQYHNSPAILLLLIDITEHKRAEDALRESEERLNFAVENAHLGLWDLNVVSREVVHNRQWTEMLGFSGGEVEISSIWWQERVHPDDIFLVLKSNDDHVSGRTPNFDCIYRMRHKNGEWRWVHSQGKIISRDSTGNPLHMIGINQDITERKLAEEQLIHFNEGLEKGIVDRTERLNASLEEKVVLLREVHHRVKNNLQIIISLLNLQSRYIEDEKTSQAIKESQNRIRAMALVHEKLYQSTDVAKINLDDYVRNLGNSLVTFYDMKGKGIGITTDIQEIPLTINTAIPVGLIINELVSNSLKHAFPDGRNGKISVAIQRTDHILTLIYKDDGIGIPDDLDWRNAKSLGLRLVVSLVEQLEGAVELDRSSGTAFKIIVKEKE